MRGRVRDKKGKRLWFVVHGWLALPIWAVLLFVFATGTISVFSYELQWLIDARVRSLNPDGRAPIGLARTVEIVQAAHPEAKIDSAYDRATYLATRVALSLPEAPDSTAYVNRYTGEIQGMVSGETFPAFMRALHAWMLLPWTGGTSLGYYIVAGLSIPLLGSLVTGIVVYKRFWRAYYRPLIRVGQGARTLLGDLHRTVGAWSIWFIAIMALSGFWFLVQGILWENEMVFGPPEAFIAPDKLPVPADGLMPPTIGVAQAIETARAAKSDLWIAYLSLPESAFSPITVTGRDWFPLGSDFASRVAVDPYTGLVISNYGTSGQSAVQFIDQIADPLHYGSFGGLWSRAIWFVFGLGLCFMAASGIIVWTKRTAQETVKLIGGASGWDQAAAAE